MKRRINNLHKGLFKLNKTSNIIELHSKKNPPEKDIEKERDKEKENLNMNQFRYINDEVNNNIKRTKNISKYDNKQNKRKSSLNKEKEVNIYENTFSDLDSSNKKSIINSKMYGNYIKSGKYFSKLRQQVIDKFISGKPLINIDRMYNNPEVKKMFGVVTNTEKTNYRSTESNNINNASSEKDELERDRRIPPSKMLPIMLNNNNNENILPLQLNENINKNNLGQNVLLNNFNDNNENNLEMNLNNISNINNNFNDIKGVGNMQEINQIDFNNMDKIKPFYLNFQKNDPTPNPPLYIPILFNNPPKTNVFEAKNNFQFINNNNEVNPLNEINNNKTHFDLFEFNNQDNFNNNNEFRRKRRSDDSQNMNNRLIKFNGVNEKINNQPNNFYQNVHQEFREPEEINNIINNLKRANDKNFNVFSNLRNDEPYFNNLMMKNDNVPNFINENLERNNNDIGFGITPKKHF